MKRRYVLCDDYPNNRFNYAEDLRKARDCIRQLGDMAKIYLDEDIWFGGIGGRDYYRMEVVDGNCKKRTKRVAVCFLEFDPEDERDEARAWSRIFNDFKSLAREAGFAIRHSGKFYMAYDFEKLDRYPYSKPDYEFMP